MLIQFLFHMIINYMNFQNMTYFFWSHLHGCVIHLINKTSTKDWRRKGQPLQCPCPEDPRDGGAWRAAVHGVAQSRTRLSDFTFPFHFHPLEKDMAAHSSALAWRIPGTGEPGGLQSMGSHRVGHDWATSLSLLTFMHWRRKWQPTPVPLPGGSQGRVI